MSAYFVTGTDTGVGKTLVSCMLIDYLRRQGVAAIGMKPVAAGCIQTEQGWINDDVERLCEASRMRPESHTTIDLINPYRFKAAIAPHLAAKLEHTQIDIDFIKRCFKTLQGVSPHIVVEGAGGFLVPLHVGEPAFKDTADLVVALDLPVILVVGIRLGCLNHALLTQQSILSRGLKLAGWVANTLDPHMIALEENIDTLKQLLQAPCLATLPFLTQTTLKRVSAYSAGFTQLLV